jgi:pimeloyl-ACP methyl ester carboxylesterase
MTVEPSERFVDVPGGSVYVQILAPSRAPSSGAAPLVLLHDSLGCVAMWRSFPSLLAERLRRPVIAYDRLGFGRSSKRTGLPSLRFIDEEAEECLPAVLRALGVGEFADFGHSVGGAMAVLAAGRLHRDCRAVVTESAQAFVEERTRQGIRSAKAGFEEAGALARLARYHGEKAEWVLHAWTDVWLSAEFTSWSLASDLPKVRCPLLAIHGARDEYGSVGFPDTICALAGGPAEKLIIADCGHVPHREKPEMVLGAVARFVEGNPDLAGEALSKY